MKEPTKQDLEEMRKYVDGESSAEAEDSIEFLEQELCSSYQEIRTLRSALTDASKRIQELTDSRNTYRTWFWMLFIVMVLVQGATVASIVWGI